MGREPEIIDAQFDVLPGSAKAGAESPRRPGILLPTALATLAAVAAAQSPTQEAELGVRVVVMLAVAFSWPFYRAIQLTVWALQSKVSEQDAGRLAERFPSRSQRRSRA